MALPHKTGTSVPSLYAGPYGFFDFVHCKIVAAEIALHKLIACFNRGFYYHFAYGD